MPSILDLFLSATWMVVNAKKSTISREGVVEDDLWCFGMQLGFKVINIDEGSTLFGFLS